MGVSCSVSQEILCNSTETPYILASSLRNYYRDLVTTIMYHLIPKYQWALSMATGCRPVSPMVISISGVASRPIKFLATRRVHMRVRSPPSHLPWDMVCQFNKPKWGPFIQWLYPEIFHLYTDTRQPTTSANVIYFYTKDPGMPEDAKNYTWLYFMKTRNIARHSVFLVILL